MDLSVHKLKCFLSSIGLTINDCTEPKEFFKVISKAVWEDETKADELCKKVMREIQNEFETYSRFFDSETNADFQLEFAEKEKNGFCDMNVDAILEAAARISQTVIVLLPPSQRITYFPHQFSPHMKKVYIVELEDRYKVAVRMEASGTDARDLCLSDKSVIEHFKDMNSISRKRFLNIAVILNAHCDHFTAAEALTNEKITDIRLFVAHKERLLSLFATDADVSLGHTIYRAKFPLAYSGENDVLIWHGKILITWLLATFYNVKWKEAKITALCNTESSGMVANLFRNYWNQLASDVSQDLTLIKTNSDILLCTSCSKTCAYRHKAWHLSLDDFTKFSYNLDEDEELTEGVMRRYSLFETPNPVPSILLEQIRQLSFAKIEVNQLIRDITSIVSDTESNAKYTSYLLLLLDGENMDKLQHVSPLKLLKRDDVIASVYAGMTKSGQFCKGNFITDKSYVRVVTCTTRLFFLRTEEFTVLSDAQKDEALVIEILKAMHNYAHLKGANSKFLVLNIRSETDHIRHVDKENLVIAGEYVLSGIPLVKMDPTDMRVFSKGNFPGNFTPVELESMPDGPYQQRTYKDVIKEYQKHKAKKVI